MKSPEAQILQYSDEKLSYEFFRKENSYRFTVQDIIDRCLGGSPFLTIHVNTNKHNNVSVQLTLGNDGLLRPAWSVRSQLKGVGYVYIINGFKHPTAQKAEWFKESDMYDADEYIKFTQHREIERQRMADMEVADLRNEMLDVIGVTGRLAIRDLGRMLPYGSKNKIREWFVYHGFTDVPEVEEFALMKDLSGWSIKSGPDGYGHQCGSIRCIDYIKKRFFVRGWSSDD